MTLNEHTLTCLVLFNDRGITLCAAAHNGKEMIQKNSFMSFFYVHDYRCVIHGCEKECRERHAVGFARQTCKAWALSDIFCLSTPSTKKSSAFPMNAMQCTHNEILWQIEHTQWGFPEIIFIIVGAVAKACCDFNYFFIYHMTTNLLHCGCEVIAYS